MKSRRLQRGQVVWFFALCAIPIALGVAYLFNSAELMSRKVRAQDAADAAAQSQAAWIARSMNVMSTNNVAFTQTEAVLSAASAVTLTATDLSIYIVRRGIQEIITAAASCPTVVGWIKCLEALGRLAVLYIAARELEDIMALIKAMPEFTEHAEAYADANHRLANGFAKFSEDMQASLAATNGLSPAPRMTAVGWDKAPGLLGGLRSTGLPVARIEWVPPAPFADTFSSGWRFVLPVNDTGEDATHSHFLVPIARNYQDHGYGGSDDGPWPRARETVKDALEDSEWWAKIDGWSATSPAQETPDYDDCWDIASMSPMVPLVYAPCTQGVLIGSTVPLYGPAASSNQTLTSYGVTDILVFTSAARSTGYVVPKRFRNGMPATYGLAKARVYNVTRPDLYSSDWRGSLVPLMSWEGNQTLPPHLRTALNRVAQTDQSFAWVLQRIQPRDLPSVLTR
jgi:hypothetical protein